MVAENVQKSIMNHPFFLSIRFSVRTLNQNIFKYERMNKRESHIREIWNVEKQDSENNLMSIHYYSGHRDNSSSVAASKNMERSFLSRGFQSILWS